MDSRRSGNNDLRNAWLALAKYELVSGSEQLFGIEQERICKRPAESDDASLGSNEAADETRGNRPAEQRRSAKQKTTN